MGTLFTMALMAYLAALIWGLFSIAPSHIQKQIKDFIQSIENK